MTTRLLIGDVFDRMAQLDDHSFDFICCSPPFGWLRSYLPDDHPDKHLEIGQEATPADYIDVMLALTAEWRRLLAPYGSIAIEHGDTYSMSGGAGGDYDPEGLRAGQPRFRQGRDRDGWPLGLSLCGIPDAYALSLEYGWNVLRRNSPDSPAGKWRVRNKKPWIRSNPPVGSLGTKNMRERSATSYITVACTGRDRWFDLDTVRTAAGPSPYDTVLADGSRYRRRNKGEQPIGMGSDAKGEGSTQGNNPGGAPPLDWWHHVDAIIDTEIDARAGKTSPGGNNPGRYQKMHGGSDSNGDMDTGTQTVGDARGVHIRRALERAGILTTLDAYDISARGYSGAHYAVWPPELVQRLVLEMCPPGGRVLDPFVGSGTTLMVCSGMDRDSVGIDLDPRSADLAMERVGMFLDIDHGTQETIA